MRWEHVSDRGVDGPLEHDNDLRFLSELRGSSFHEAMHTEYLASLWTYRRTACTWIYGSYPPVSSRFVSKTSWLCWWSPCDTNNQSSEQSCHDSIWQKGPPRRRRRLSPAALAEGGGLFFGFRRNVRFVRFHIVAGRSKTQRAKETLLFSSEEFPVLHYNVASPAHEQHSEIKAD